MFLSLGHDPLIQRSQLERSHIAATRSVSGMRKLEETVSGGAGAGEDKERTRGSSLTSLSLFVCAALLFFLVPLCSNLSDNSLSSVPPGVFDDAPQLRAM